MAKDITSMVVIQLHRLNLRSRAILFSHVPPSALNECCSNGTVVPPEKVEALPAEFSPHHTGSFLTKWEDLTD